MAYRRRGRYWYRSKRKGHQVVTEYLGAGDVAALWADVDVMDREERERARAAFRAEVEAQRAIDGQLAALGGALREWVSAVLLAHGYHMHKGQWRRQCGHDKA